MFRLIYNNIPIVFSGFLIFFCIGLPAFFQSVMAQNTLIDYQNTTKSLFYNPALNSPKGQHGISIFPLASNDFEIFLPVSLNDIFVRHLDRTNYTLDLSRLSKRVGMVNQVTANSTISYLNYSYKLHSTNWGFLVYENVYSAFSFEKNLVEFVNKGNFDYVNRKFSTQIPLSLSSFTTFQFSLSKKVSNKFRFGISAKLYSGKSMINSNTGFTIFTDSLLNYVDIGLSGSINASVPLSRSINSAGHVDGVKLLPDLSLANYLLNFKNPGAGIDLGIHYRCSEKIDLSASIIDLGFISWVNNSNSIDIDRTYHWNGIDVTRLISAPTDTSFMNGLSRLNIADTILFSGLSPSDKKTITFTPLKVYLSFNYQYNKKLSFSATNRLTLLNSFLTESFMLTGNYSFANNWNIYSGLGISNRSFLNIPLGFSFMNKRFYASMSVSNLWGLVIPSYSRNFGGSLCAGYYFNSYSHSEKEEMKNFPIYKMYKKWIEN